MDSADNEAMMDPGLVEFMAAAASGAFAAADGGVEESKGQN
jgi:hypothetical protein